MVLVGSIVNPSGLTSFKLYLLWVCARAHTFLFFFFLCVYIHTYVYTYIFCIISKCKTIWFFEIFFIKHLVLLWPSSFLSSWSHLLFCISPHPTILFSSPFHLWSLYVFLISVLILCCIFISEDLEQGNTGGWEYIVFIFLKFRLSYSTETFIGLPRYLKISWCHIYS